MPVVLPPLCSHAGVSALKRVQGEGLIGLRCFAQHLLSAWSGALARRGGAPAVPRHFSGLRVLYQSMIKSVFVVSVMQNR